MAGRHVKDQDSTQENMTAIGLHGVGSHWLHYYAHTVHKMSCGKLVHPAVQKVVGQMQRPLILAPERGCQPQLTKTTGFIAGKAVNHISGCRPPLPLPQRAAGATHHSMADKGCSRPGPGRAQCRQALHYIANSPDNQKALNIPLQNKAQA